MKRSAVPALAAGSILVMTFCAAVPAPVAAQRASADRASARASAQAKPASRPATQKPGALVAGTAPTPAAPQAAGTVGNPCDYLDPAEAAPIVGAEATLMSAPSRGAFMSCGYTSPTGDSVTLSIAEYGLIDVAQQFFTRNRDSLKTAVKDDASYGVPAFTWRSADQPTRVTYGAVKGSKTITLEASGPLASSPQAGAHLRAILTKALAKVSAEAPPPPDDDEAVTVATSEKTESDKKPVKKPTAPAKPKPRP